MSMGWKYTPATLSGKSSWSSPIGNSSNPAASLVAAVVAPVAADVLVGAGAEALEQPVRASAKARVKVPVAAAMRRVLIDMSGVHFIRWGPARAGRWGRTGGTPGV